MKYWNRVNWDNSTKSIFTFVVANLFIFIYLSPSGDSQSNPLVTHQSSSALQSITIFMIWFLSPSCSSMGGLVIEPLPPCQFASPLSLSLWMDHWATSIYFLLMWMPPFNLLVVSLLSPPHSANNKSSVINFSCLWMCFSIFDKAPHIIPLHHHHSPEPSRGDNIKFIGFNDYALCANIWPGRNKGP